MVARGAKGTDAELAAILDYLTAQFGPAAPGARSAPFGPAGGRGRSAAYLPGSADKHVVDEAAANRGRKVYAAECINCHGTHARGTDNGADLIRSEVVLHDRYGSTIGPFLKKGHPTQTTPVAQLTAAQIEDLSHTIHQEVYNTLRSALEIQNVLTGDSKAGAAYFNGEGKCSTCHSPTGDLAHIGFADGSSGVAAALSLSRADAEAAVGVAAVRRQSGDRHRNAGVGRGDHRRLGASRRFQRRPRAIARASIAPSSAPPP